MKFCVLTFGCRTNQADSFDLERDLRAQGGEPAPEQSADVVVVNTCTVTGAADQAARNAIRRIARLNPSARIVATGCYATRHPAEVGQLPGVVLVVENPEKGGAFDRLGAAAGVLGPPTLQNCEIAPEGISHFCVPGTRGRTAYPLRVQTGCDERCAYCIVPSTRGPGRSRALPDVLGEVRAAAAAGFKEFWVTGVHLGSYGRDLRPALSLLDLLIALHRTAAGLDVTFRLSSLEPMDCTEEILDCVAGSPRFLPHVHLPLQHASDRMLAAMRRPYTRAGFDAAVTAVRRRLPDAAIGTDLIVGFPGETGRDFAEQIDYLRASALTHVHVFPYSDRPGTEASRMADKVAAGEIRRRSAELRTLAAALQARFVVGQVGRERPALTLAKGTVALTDNYIKVGIPSGRKRNERVRIRILSADPVRGEIPEYPMQVGER